MDTLCLRSLGNSKHKVPNYKLVNTLPIFYFILLLKNCIKSSKHRLWQFYKTNDYFTSKLSGNTVTAPKSLFTFWNSCEKQKFRKSLKVFWKIFDILDSRLNYLSPTLFSDLVKPFGKTTISLNAIKKIETKHFGDCEKLTWSTACLKLKP